MEPQETFEAFIIIGITLATFAGLIGIYCRAFVVPKKKKAFTPKEVEEYNRGTDAFLSAAQR